MDHRGLLVWALILGVVAVGQGQAATPYVCYASDQDPYLQFGTKTSYEFSSGRTAGPGGQGETKGIPGCRPILVWMVARHGAKNPTTPEVDKFRQIIKLRDEINRNYEERTSKLCPTDAQNLQQWQFTFNPQEEDQISVQGKEDLNLFGKRVRTRFEELIGQQEYNDRSFLFRYTTSVRARSSAQAFSEGVFPNVQINLQPAADNDTMLRSYHNCPAWEAMVDNNPETLKQLDLFLALPEFGKMVYSISQRLGFRYNLTQDTILYAYDICRYEKANNIKTVSAWCSLFTADELKLIEYAEDLKYYYNAGYGNALNLRIGCPLLQDMMYRFRAAASGTSEQLGVFYFTHQTALLTLLARMGIANDQTPPSHSNFGSQSRRQWRTSSLVPFGGNLMAVFFNCSGSSGVEQKVVFYLQESVVPLPGCEAGVCTWETVRDKFMSIADECNVNRTCAGLDSGAAPTGFAPTLFLVALFAIVWQASQV